MISIFAEQEPEVQKPRIRWSLGSRSRRFLAGLASAVVPGIGHFAHGQYGVGALWLAFFATGLSATFLFKSWTQETGLVTVLFVFAFFGTTAASHTAFRRHDLVTTTPPKIAVVLFFIVAWVSSVYGNQWIWSLAGYRTFSIPSTAMEPTIRPENAIVADMHAYRNLPPKRGDVIVYIGVGPVYYGKRVIGLPGETIQGIDGRIILNGAELEEEYVVHREDKKILMLDNTNRKLLTFGPYRLGSDEYFVMGDNRDMSYDSRITGPIIRDTILGKALYLLDKQDLSRSGQRLDATEYGIDD